MYKDVGLLLLGIFFALPAPVAAQQGQVTFSRDVAPVLFNKCVQCHRPDGGGPFSLLTYEVARQHATQIALQTQAQLMPPWKARTKPGEFIGLDPLTSSEIDLIQRWVAQGAPQGNARDLPAPPRFDSNWQLGGPDMVVTFPEPYVLAADGPDVSRVFVVPVPLKQLRYIRGFEFHPNNPRVHHANIRIDSTSASWQVDEQDRTPGYDGIILRSAVYPDGHFLGWTPGQAAPLLPRGLSWSLAPDSYLVIQLHMVPSGKPERIQPSIALYFTNDAPERTPVMMRLSREDINIPAGDSRYIVEDSFTLPVDAEIEAVQPHAHYLAHEVRGTATLPDGSTRTLIDIPDWDLRWQHVYRYVTPFTLPKGTVVSMRFVYDNSAQNPRNPANPPVPVSWGQQSREEMGDLWIQAIARTTVDRETLRQAFEPKWLATDAVGYESLIRRDPANVRLRDDVAVLYMELKRPADAARHFQAVADLRPDSASAHFNLATAMTSAGRLSEAVARYQRALELRPGYALALNNLGTTLLRLGRPQEALEQFRAAVAADPALLDATMNAGTISMALGNQPAALGYFQEAVRRNPTSAAALSRLASLLAASPDASLRNPQEAVRLAEQAVSVTGRREANTLDILAVALGSAGDFDRAIAICDEALALNPEQAVSAMIRQHQELFRKKMPYVSTR
jgi:tetratricopeptide (TPR) repeat protein